MRVPLTPVRSWKIIICGEGAVGKTTLIKTIKLGKFYSGATETIAVEFHTIDLSKISHGSLKGIFQIWDLGGQEHYYDMDVFKKYSQEVDLAVCCFDVNDLGTLEEIPRWVEILPKHTTRLLVGLKTDLVLSTDNIVDFVEDYKVSFKFLSTHFLSSTDAEAVKQFFQYLIELVIMMPEKGMSNFSENGNCR